MAADPSRLTIGLLGPPEVTIDGVPLSVDTRKAVAILAYLAATSSTPSRDQLATLLWPDADPERARSALRRTLSSLRSGLGGRWVEAGRDRVALDPVGLDLDLDLVDLAMAVATRDDIDGNDSISLAQLAAADELHRGDFMSGFSLRDAPEFDAWLTEMSEVARRRHRTILSALVDGYAGVGRYADAVRSARRWVAMDPLDEIAHRRLMLMLAWTGDRSGAVEAYRACVRVLDVELGVPPLEETSELYEAILDEDLPRRPAHTSVRTASAAPVRIDRPLPRLVGRETEMESLIGLAVGRSGSATVITGEPGIGKTRLIEEVIAAVGEDRPVMVVRGARAEHSLPFGVVAALLGDGLEREQVASRIGEAPDWALAEAERVVPAIGRLRSGSEPPPLDHPSTELRFHEGLIELLSHLTRGGVLAVDDAQHADPASTALLTMMARRIGRLGLALIVSCRSDELPPDSLLPAAVREGVFSELALAPLSGERSVELLRTATGRTEDADALLRRTGGVPLFIVDDLESQTGRAQAILAQRVERLGEVARQILAAAAVATGTTDERWIQSVAGRSDEETVQGVEELMAARMLRALPDGGIELAHDVLREVVYRGMSLVRRRLLHRRAAGLHAHERAAGSVAAAAHHYRMAGLEDEAAELSLRAADLARSVFAHAEAGEHYRTALALGHPDRAAIHQALGDIALLRGDFGESRTHYMAALALASGSAAALLEHRIGETARRLGDFDTAERHFSRATGDHPSPASLHADWALLEYRRTRTDRAAEHAAAALDSATTAAERARALDILAVLEPDGTEAEVLLERSLELAGDDPVLRMAALNNLSVLAADGGDLERSLSLAYEALGSAVRAGDRHREAALLNRLADLYHRMGDEDRSREHLTRAVTLFREIGSSPEAWEPEVWLLTRW